MNPHLPEYIDLNFEEADFAIVQKGRSEPIQISWDPDRKCHIASSSSSPEVYYKVDLLCDSSGFCTCPSFTQVQSKRHRPCKHIVRLDIALASKEVT